MTKEEAKQKAIELYDEYARKHIKLYEEKKGQGLVFGLDGKKFPEEIEMMEELKRKLKELHDQIDE